MLNLRLVVATTLTTALLLACAAPSERSGSAGPYDIVIAGGTVLDGTGNPSSIADVGVRDGRIVAVGDLRDAESDDRIDASGLVVAPGFIDVHSHADRGMTDPALKHNAGFLTQGVTTSVFGVDGSYAPVRIRELIEIFDRQGVGTNYAFYVGHNGIRREVMGMENRPPTEDELAAMKALVDEGMDTGAFGLSTGLMYLPGNFASTDEVIELTKVAAARGGIYDSHIRDPAKNLVASVAEAIEISAAAGAHAHPAHHKAPGMANFGKGQELSNLIADAIAAGQPVTVDQYPYDGAATARLIEIPLTPPGFEADALVERFRAEGTSEADRTQLLDQIADLIAEELADPATRATVRGRTEHPPDGVYSWVDTVGYASFRLVTSDAHPDWEGRMIVDIAKELDLAPFDLIVKLIEDDGAVAKITLGACLEDDVRTILTRPWTIVASDGEITGYEGGGGHPRGRGTFPRVLGRYVREWRVLTLAEAIHKMTGMPADLLQLGDRGRIAEGQRADITIFDADSVIDRATWREPSLYSEGIVHVLVNGTFALRDGDVTGATAGVQVAPTRPAAQP